VLSQLSLKHSSSLGLKKRGFDLLLLATLLECQKARFDIGSIVLLLFTRPLERQKARFDVGQLRGTRGFSSV
jgi:hypothetical protein